MLREIREFRAFGFSENSAAAAKFKQVDRFGALNNWFNAADDDDDGDELGFRQLERLGALNRLFRVRVAVVTDDEVVEVEVEDKKEDWVCDRSRVRGRGGGVCTVEPELLGTRGAMNS